MSINYAIRVKGTLDERWKSQFEGLALRHESSEITVLSGPLRDQPALHGILERIRDLNLTLVSVTEEGGPLESQQRFFRSALQASEYLRQYDAALARWPVQAERLEIGTSFGMTHVNAVGPREAPPLILLPGFGANSTMFIRNIEALSRGNRVYGIDTIGQPGRSVPSRSAGASSVHEWLKEVLDALGIGRAKMAGVSLGGWIALDFAVRHPERTDRVALVDPAASFAPMSLKFVLRSFIPVMVHPTRGGLARYFRWLTRGGSVDREWGELMILGILSCKPQPPIRATPFSAKQLERCTAPLLLLIGENSVTYSPHRVLSRASRLIPGIRAQIIPNASHGLLMEQADLVNARLCAFFES